MRFWNAIGHPAVGVSIVLAITTFYRHAQLANETTVGFTFLLVILIASAVAGLRTSILMSLAATLTYDYFFLPPVGTLNITDYRDWVALSAFLVTSVVGSGLSAWARSKTEEAHRGRREVEQLYDLSQKLLNAGNSLGLCKAIPADIVDAFGAATAALLLADGETIFYSPGASQQIDAGGLKASLNHREVQVGTGNEFCSVPLRLGVKVTGSIGIAGATLSDTTLEALGSLVSIAIERARAIEQVGKIEALRESERLKSALRDAIAHEFRTPLTSMKLSVTGMLSDLNFDREQCRELLNVIDQGCDRIDRLVGEVSELSGLESGEVKFEFKPHSVAELIEAALTDCKGALGARPVECERSSDSATIRADLFWATKVLAHLISNANLYSSPGEPITIRTKTKGAFVFFTVADRGPGIDPSEASRIFEKFYRGKSHCFTTHGTGMGLSIAKAIVEAHAGTIGVTSKLEEGSVFYFSLPIDRSSEAEE